MARMRGRSGAVATALGIVVLVAWSLQPATAHLGSPVHLWTEHIRPKADERYLRNTNVFVSAPFTLVALDDATVTRMCPAGWQAVGGGADFEAANANVQVISSAPLVGDSNLFSADEGKNPASGGWRVTMSNDGLLDVDGVVGVICAK
jgi:hypothetical protein